MQHLADQVFGQSPVIARYRQHWQGCYRKKLAGEPLPQDMTAQDRIRELERRNRELEMENAFLKKAASYFATEQR